MTVRSDTVVVANLVVLNTVNIPDVVALPFASTVKLEFAVHPDPFQYSV